MSAQGLILLSLKHVGGKIVANCEAKCNMLPGFGAPVEGVAAMDQFAAGGTPTHRLPSATAYLRAYGFTKTYANAPDRVMIEAEHQATF
jgi:hypothetical protein